MTVRFPRRLNLADDPPPVSPPVATTPAGVEVVDNHIYFYTEVNNQTGLALINILAEMEADLIREKRARRLALDIPIWLHINSGGGEVFPALAAVDYIAMMTVPVYSIVEGLCASAASLLSLACRKRYILRHGFMLIHQVRGGWWGTYAELQDELKLADMLMKKLTIFYKATTKLDHHQIEEALRRDSWFDAEQAVAAGLADEIYRKQVEV
jgi:ATP-dependent protease ClpP protease subunit